MRGLQSVAVILAVSLCVACGQTGKQEQTPAKAPKKAVKKKDIQSPALAIFESRILPIFRADKPSSCTECHLSGVELKDYIRADQGQTFAALVNAGLINAAKPNESKILTFIQRKPDKPNLITDKIRKTEYEAFQAWILAAVKDPDLLKRKDNGAIGSGLPNEVIRHARTDRVLASFIDNVWTERGRCTGCHSPDQNRKQVQEHGEQVSWIKLRDPQATLDYMLEADLIDVENPEKSLLLLKPTMQVKHGGGQKMVIGDRSYRQFRKFIDDYSAIVGNKYKSAKELPKRNNEVSFATSMTRGIWLKFTDVPPSFDTKLLQVDLYRREGETWSKQRWATADRGVAGKLKLWQQTLSLTATRGTPREKDILGSLRLPPGKYLAKIYVDQKSKLGKASTSGLGKMEFVGEVVIQSRWRTGYGRMTVAKFPK